MRVLYLNDNHLRMVGLQWNDLVNRVEHAVTVMDQGDYAQPLKPYLRYNDPANRIIAMPAYIGGDVQAAGLKWIASFPGNIHLGLPRAHSVTVLNNAASGVPYAIINAPLASAARTAAVSGLVLRHYLKAHPGRRMRVGIIGWGPIGQLHFDMCAELYGDLIDSALVYDIREPKLDDIHPALRGKTLAASTWRQLYAESDVVITCTVSSNRYIDVPPAPGMLLLDVSLRDFMADAIGAVKAVIVDDWNEVCRENTDIELLHKECGLVKEQTRSLADVVCREALAAWGHDEPVLFCPMGMASFDLSVADYMVRRAEALGIGVGLE